MVGDLKHLGRKAVRREATRVGKAIYCPATPDGQFQGAGYTAEASRGTVCKRIAIEIAGKTGRRADAYE